MRHDNETLRGCDLCAAYDRIGELTRQVEALRRQRNDARQVCMEESERSARAEHELKRLRRLPHDDNDGQAHYAGCWRDRGHHNCAVREVERLSARLRRVEDTYVMRSELFTSDAQCAANLADLAREGLRQCVGCDHHWQAERELRAELESEL